MLLEILELAIEYNKLVEEKMGVALPNFEEESKMDVIADSLVKKFKKLSLRKALL